MTRISTVLAAVLLFLPLGAAGEVSGGEQPIDGPDVEVFHLSIGPGEKAMTRFGHDALRVRDLRNGRDVLYNWGAFRAEHGENFRALLLRRLEASLALGAWRPTVERYRAEDRRLVLQRLDLPAEATARLIALLERNFEPENRDYPYHTTRDNCTTRLRDILDAALGGALRAEAEKGGTFGTRRDHLMNAVDDSAVANMVFTFMALILDLRLDRPVESVFEGTFLPLDLKDLLAAAEVAHADGGRRPLVAAEMVLHEGPSDDGWRPNPWLWGAGLLVLVPCAAACLDRRRGRRWAAAGIALWGVMAGLLGVGMLVIALWALPGGNAWGNLLVFSPLHLALVPFGWALGRGRLEPRASRILGSTLAVLAGVAVLRLAAEAAGLTRYGHVEVGAVAVAAGVMALAAWWSVWRRRT